MLTLYAQARVRPQNHPFKLTTIVFMKSKTLLISTLFAAAAMSAGTATAATYTWVGNNNNNFHNGGYAACNKNADGTWVYSEFGGTQDWQTDTSPSFPAISKLFSTLGNQLNTLRFVTPGETLTAGSETRTVSTTNKAPSVSFSDLLLGGLIVESGASGYSIVQSGNRTFRLGKENDTTAFDGTINEDFTLTGQTIRAYSTQNWAVASGKTMKFNGNIEGNAEFNIMKRDGNKDTSGTVDFLGNVTAKSLRTGISTVTVHTGKTFRLGRIELGDSFANGDKAAKIVVETGAKLLVTGSTNDAGNASNSQYKRNTIVLGEWQVKGNLEVKGTFLANKAVVFFGDTGGDVTVAENATMVVSGYGLSCDDRTNSTEQLTVNSGAKLILGDFGLKNKAGNNHPAASITAATIGAFKNKTVIEKNIILGAGATTIDTDLYAVDMSAGTVAKGENPSTSIITVSGVISGAGKLSFVGNGVTKLSGANTFTGGIDVTAGTLSVENATGLGTGAVSVATGAKMIATEALTGVGAVTNRGLITLEKGATFTDEFESTGTLSVVSGTVTFKENATKTLAGEILLDKNVNVKNLNVVAGTLLLASRNTLENATLAGTSLKIGGAAVGEKATKLSGKVSFVTGNIDLSSVAFFGSDLSRTIFNATGVDSTQTTAMLNALNGGQIVTNVEGTWAFTESKFIFTATNPNMVAWSKGTSKGDSGSWDATNFNGQTVGGSVDSALPLVFDAVPNVDTVTINVKGDVYASLAQVSGETTYVFEGANSIVNIGTALRIRDGELVVNTAMKVDGEGIDIQAGGSLTVGAAGTLQMNNVSLAQGATLNLNHQNALSSLNGTTGTNITMAGGSTISFVQGGLSGAEKIHISETSEGKSAVLSLAANQPTNKDNKAYQLEERLEIDVDSHITFDVGKESWLDLTGAQINKAGNFTKTGAGTLVLTGSKTLTGKLTINGGTVALGSGGEKDGEAVFAGNITIGQNSTLALIRSNSFSSNNHSATIDVYGKVYIGQDVVYDGEGADIPTQTVNGLTFNLYGGSIDGVETNDSRLIEAKNMTVNAKAGYESSMGKYLIELAGTSIFTVENGATLTVNSTFIEKQPQDGTAGTSYGFTKAGEGKMILADTMTVGSGVETQFRNFSGTVDVTGGILEVQGTLGNASGVTLTSDTTQLIFNRSTTVALNFNGVISGSGNVDVQAGTIHLTNTTGGLTATGALTIANGAALIVDVGTISQETTLGGSLTAEAISGKLTLQEGATIGHSAATNKNVTISGEIDATVADVLTVAGGANLTFSSTNVTGGDLDFVVKESATVNLTGTTAVSDLTIVGEGKVAGTWELDTLTLVDAGEKTLGIVVEDPAAMHTATVTIGSGKVAIGANASLNITAGSTLTGSDMGLTISGAGTLTNAGTIESSNLTLGLSSAQGGTMIDNSGTIKSTGTSTIGAMAIKNAGTLELGKASITGDVNVANTGTVVGEFNVADNKTLTVSGGQFGKAGETITISGEGGVKLGNNTSVVGKIAINDGRLNAGLSFGVKPDFSQSVNIANSTLESLKLDAGTLTATTISLVGTDANATEKLVELRNGSMLNGDVTVVAKTIATGSSTTILMENSNINGSLALWGVTGDLSNVNVSGVLNLQNHISVDRHNHFVANGVPTGGITKDTDYAGVKIANDVSIGGISGAELAFIYNSSGSYTVDGGTTSYKIETVDVDFNLDNVDAIGESYVLYNGRVFFKTEDNVSANWSNISITSDDTAKKYTVNLDGKIIGNITFADGTNDLYLDIAQNGIVVKRAGTFVWKDGIEKWSDAKWDKTQKNDVNLTNQLITSGDNTYVTITNASVGSSLKIDTDAVQVGGLNFRNVTNFNFDQSGNTITGKNLNIENSSVVIKNLGANAIKNAIIGAGSTLTIDSVATGGKLSETQITLAGTLAFNADYSGGEKLILNGTAAAISVADGKTATLGTATGATATLAKDGAGTLKLSGNSEIANVKVNAGTLNFVGSTTDNLKVAALVQAAGTTVSVDSKFVKTNVSLGANAILNLKNEATDQKLNTLILTDGAKLSSTAALNIGNDTQISSTGTATISAELTQVVDTKSSVNTNAGTLTIQKFTLQGVTDAGQKDASLVKTGSGTLKIENGDLGGTIYLTAGTLSLSTITKLGTIMATAGATLDLTGTVSTDANSEIQVANDSPLTFKTANAFTFNGSLLIDGTLKIDQKSAMVTLAGTGNQYEEIEFNKLTFASGFESTVAGTLKIVGSDAHLKVESGTLDSLGSLNLSKSLTLDLAENANAQFGNLYGSLRSTLTVTGTGSATFAGIDEMAIKIDSSATVKFVSGNLGVINGGANATLEKIGANTTLVTKVANNDFTGTVKVSEGKFGFLQGGAFANAKLEVAGTGEAIIAYDSKSKVAIGAVADATTIAKTLTGNGKLTVANSNELSFEKKELVDGFTGTLALENGVANLKNFSTGAIVQMSSNSKIVLNETFTLKKLEFAFNDTNQIDFSAVDANQTLTISDFGYIKNQTTGTAGTLGIRVETGTVEFAKPITKKLNLVAFGSGTLKLLDTDHDIGELSAGFIEGGEAVTVDLTGATGTNKIETVNLSGATIKLSANTTVGKFVSDSSASVIETVGGMELNNIDLFTGTVRNTSGTLTLNRDGTTLATRSNVYGFGENTANVITRFNIKSDMSQGGATFAGAGTIEINAEDDTNVAKTLTLNKASKDFTGTLKLTAGTLKMTEAATLGTGNVELATGTTLALAPENNNANVVIGGKVSGDGKIEKTGGSTAFIGGEVGVLEIVLKGGTLAVTDVKDNSAIKFDGAAVFETGKKLNDEGNVVNLSADDSEIRAINAKFNASTNATFSHSSDFGKTTITGSWESGTAPTGVITLAGGGTGSVFDLQTNGALVKKTGTGKWMLNNAIGGSLTVVAGTLSVQKFATATNQTILVNSAGTLEITGLNSGMTKIEGDFYGDGTIRIQTATPTELGSLGNASSSLFLNIASEVSVKSDLRNTIMVASNGKLNFVADSEFTYDGFLRGETGAMVKKTGAGVLTLGENYDGEVDLTIEAGTVKVIKSLGSSSKGIVTVNTGAMLEAAGTDVKITKQLEGTGTLKFSSGTTTITAKSDFAGTVEIAQGATIVYSSKNYAAGLGTENITGKGTLRVDYTNAAMETDWTATGFAGDLEIKKGTVAITQEKFNALHNNFKIKFTGTNENDATLKLSGTGIAVDGIGNLVALEGKVGTLAIDGTAMLDGTFGNGVSLRVLDGSALTTSGGEVSANLTIDKGATMTLAAPQTRMARTSTRSNSALLTVGGNLTVAGTMNVETANSIAMNGGNVLFADTAQVIFTTLPGNDVFISGVGSVNIDRNASFTLGDGTVLRAAVNEGAGTLVIGEYIESYGPAGMSDFAALINSNQDSDIWRAWRQESSGQDGILRNFSPVSFGALTEMTMSVARASNDLLRQRLEQRRYDRAIPMAMMVGTNTFYANGFGGTRDSGESSGENPNYDLNYFGAQAGFDTILSGQAIAGVNLNCATGKANIHANGGKHESSSIGVGIYGQYMFDELTYLGVGARLGFDAYDTKRRTAFGEVEGETSGFDMGLSATLGRLIVLDASNGIHFSPYLGLDLDYVAVGSFDETETANDTALRVDSFDRISLRGIAGASLTWVPVPEWRFTLDASVRHEFVGNDSDIDATFQSGIYAGKKSTTTAYYANETSLSIGPRVEYRFNNSWAVNAAYAYETDFEEATSHNANIGLSARF